ncbi:glycosyltransferase [Streptomyces ipomoeae]|nr:glycosyltransferase [Streptomyces ipomoeae]TQE36240.1 glycosyltransferase [Streptomyces ipomoeae]
MQKSTRWRQSMAAKLSVVVPIYNVEPYLPGLLDSLAAQELTDIQVVLVDDGSTDGSSAIAKAMVAEDRRFELISQSNQGLSAARNAGTRVATGRYLAFADADDVVPEKAYRMLVDALEQSGSDIASGDVRRLRSNEVERHGGYADLFATTRLRTHITRDDSLVADRMVWNKVFRRSFWDHHGLEFFLPQYEDAPVTIHAHILASSVDVLSDVVYLWRFRELGEPSITQRHYEPANVAARMRMVVETGDIILRLAPELHDVFAKDMLTGDVFWTVEAGKMNGASDLADSSDLLHRFLGTVEPAVLRQMPAPYLRRVRLFAAGRIDELRAEFAKMPE